jgi:hypothetical protein
VKTFYVEMALDETTGDAAVRRINNLSGLGRIKGKDPPIFGGKVFSL